MTKKRRSKPAQTAGKPAPVELTGGVGGGFEAEGGAGVLLRQLGRVCGSLPEDIEGRVRSLSYPEMEALGERLLDLRTLDDQGVARRQR